MRLIIADVRYSYDLSKKKKKKTILKSPKYAQYQVSNFPALPKTSNKKILTENNIIPDGKSKSSSYAKTLKECGSAY